MHFNQDIKTALKLRCFDDLLLGVNSKPPIITLTNLPKELKQIMSCTDSDVLKVNVQRISLHKKQNDLI